jgi:hypothetical protein
MMTFSSSAGNSAGIAIRNDNAYAFMPVRFLTITETTMMVMSVMSDKVDDEVLSGRRRQPIMMSGRAVHALK